MLKPFEKLAEIPKLLKYSKYLTESNYLTKDKSHSLLQECSVYADRYRNSNNIRESESAQVALNDLKEFSRWLRKK